MQLDSGSRLLRDVAFLRTYAETLSSGKKETVEQTFNRVMKMHAKKFPHLAEKIDAAFEAVRRSLVVPSMRSMQFAGYPIERSEVRIYNCAYTPIESFKDIADSAWISMNGTGVGYSVQLRHVSKLPVISGQEGCPVFAIPDSKEGWADSILMLLGNPCQNFDYSLIRPKGAPLTTGGTASGPMSLQLMHDLIRNILVGALGRQLRPIEVHDIMCHMGDLVRCGGVRRTALISLFDCFDEEMLTAKSGSWWVNNAQRGRANNSAVIHRDDPNVEEQIRRVLKFCFDSNAGEPGIFMTNDYDWGANPCVEIGLKPRQFCNLTEVNVAACKSVEDLKFAVEAAAIIGTLQASYTNFNYIDSRWKSTCKEDALLGLSMTGQAEAQWLLSEETLKECSSIALQVNREWAELLGINPAARIGCTKPSGSTAAFLCTTSGIHAAHDDYYLRRIRIDKPNPLAKYLTDRFGLAPARSYSVVEQDEYSEDQIVLTVPICKAGSIKRYNESPIELLERVKHIHKNWIATTHRLGSNTHNVSVTVSYKAGEEQAIADWMVDNREVYSGISLLPYDGGSYSQMPFESVTEEQYKDWANRFSVELDLYSVDFSGTQDNRKDEAACAGGMCELV